VETLNLNPNDASEMLTPLDKTSPEKHTRAAAAASAPTVVRSGLLRRYKLLSCASAPLAQLRRSQSRVSCKRQRAVPRHWLPLGTVRNAQREEETATAAVDQSQRQLRISKQAAARFISQHMPRVDRPSTPVATLVADDMTAEELTADGILALSAENLHVREARRCWRHQLHPLRG